MWSCWRSPAPAGVRKIAVRMAEPPLPGARLNPLRLTVRRWSPARSRMRRGAAVSGNDQVAADLAAEQARETAVDTHLDGGHDLALEPDVPGTGAGDPEGGVERSRRAHHPPARLEAPRGRHVCGFEVDPHERGRARRDEHRSLARSDASEGVDARAANRRHSTRREARDRRAGPPGADPTPGSRCPARAAGTRKAAARRRDPCASRSTDIRAAQRRDRGPG